MQLKHRKLLAALACAGFAVFWAILQWPWMLHQQRDLGEQFGPWLFAAYFAVLSVALVRFPRIARWLALISGVLLLSFLLLVVLAAVGVGSSFCTASDWRCYAEPTAISITGLTLVLACFRPLQGVAAAGAA